jgi:transaldolase
MSKNKQILELYELGQSIWYDNLSRDVLRSGKLADLIEAGVSGLTSNPTIFKKAIADTDDYDSDLSELVKSGLGVEQLCEQLMLQDVQSAADLLKPVYDETRGKDGYASLEVSPLLARDTNGTIEAARNLWSKLGRPNAMIKVPATVEGLPAIKVLLAEGININVTLIFSAERYSQVVETYMEALEVRAAKGLPLNGVASVASFFVSRVDAICEKYFSQMISESKASEEAQASFLGQVGIDNSRLAYSLFEQEFGSERYSKLKSAGARVQRPLWASTGTKNPDFNPLLYLEELIGDNTVNTLPPDTLELLLQRARIEPKLGASNSEDSPGTVISFLKAKGVPFDNLLDELEQKGVKSFADSYNDLLDSIEQKVKTLQ